jgi:hypothetical protein
MLSNLKSSNMPLSYNSYQLASIKNNQNHNRNNIFTSKKYGNPKNLRISSNINK